MGNLEGKQMIFVHHASIVASRKCGTTREAAACRT